MNKHVFLLLLLLPVNLCAQKHGYVWVWGSNFAAGGKANVLDFKQKPPRLSTINIGNSNGVFPYPPVQAAMSDSAGNLLFYTNIAGIWRGQKRIPGSKDLNMGRDEWTDNEVFSIPLPGSPDRYALIHKGGFIWDYEPLYVSVIDSLFNKEQGKVMVANQLLLENYRTGRVVACKHGNGRDWWIIVPTLAQVSGIIQTPDLGFQCFLLTESGVLGPIKHAVRNLSFVPDFAFTYKECALSADGNWLASRHSKDSIGIYFFDRCSGNIVLNKVIPHHIKDCGHYIEFAFSPDNRFLYAITMWEMISIDLQASSSGPLPDEARVIAKSRSYGECLDDYWHFWYPLNGPDGKIYVQQGLFTDFRTFTYVMHRPNLPPSSNDVEWEGLIWPVKSLIQHEMYQPNYELGKWTSSPCDTLSERPSNAHFVHTPWHRPMDAQKNGTTETTGLHLLFKWADIEVKNDTLNNTIHKSHE